LEAEAKKLDQQEVDQREIPVTLIKDMLKALKFNDPMIVLYFAPPYCPHNTLKNEVQEEKAVKEQLIQMVKEFGEKKGLDYQVLQFFPSLSDSSYLKIDDSPKSLQALKRNFPMMEQFYDLPIETIKSLNIPALDFGVYGKDAHKWMERVNKHYSFEILPELILEAVHTMLYEEE
jgi:arginine utilization protein RocB